MAHFATIQITLRDFAGNCDLAWVREHLFEATLRYRAWLDGLSHARAETPAVVAAVAGHAHAVADAVTQARDSLALTRLDADVALSFSFAHNASLERGEDGRMLWVRQAFEDLIWSALRAALLQNSRCVLLSKQPPSEEVSAALRIWNDALDDAMLGANDAQCPTFIVDLEQRQAASHP